MSVHFPSHNCTETDHQHHHLDAGTYIPYITKAYFEMENPPVNLVKIAIGDGTIGSDAVFNDAPTVSLTFLYPTLPHPANVARGVVDNDPRDIPATHRVRHRCLQLLQRTRTSLQIRR